MQEVQNTTTANYISGDSKSTKATQNNTSDLFQSLLNQDIEPQEISFDEYKSLNEEDIEKLFSNDEEALKHAKGLKNVASWTNDDTYNSIVFDIYVDDIKNGTNNGQMYFHAQLLTVQKAETITAIDENFSPSQSGVNITDANEMLDFLSNIKVNIQKQPDKEWIQSLDTDKIIEVSNYIVEQYNSKTQQNNAALTSYTRTNTTTPTNSTTETSETEQTSQATNKYEKMFQRIIEDGYVSYDEVEYFTYDQALAFPEYLMKKDENGEFIKSTLVDMDRKTGMLLSGASLNKAIFHSVRKIEDEQTLETFMYDMTGTQFSDKIFAYPELQNVDYEEQGGFSHFIAKKNAEYQVKLDNATTEEEKETYQEMVGAFTRLDHMNKSFNNQSIHDNSDPFEKLRALVADIVSMFKTGFTVEELERIEEILKEIREKIKEYKENGTGSIEEIDEMMKQLERFVVELQKRITGVAILDVSDSTNTSTGEMSFASLADLNIEQRIDAIQDSLNEMRSGELLKEGFENDEEEEEESKKE